MGGFPGRIQVRLLILVLLAAIPALVTILLQGQAAVGQARALEERAAVAGARAAAVQFAAGMAATRGLLAALEPGALQVQGRCATYLADVVESSGAVAGILVLPRAGPACVGPPGAIPGEAGRSAVVQAALQRREFTVGRAFRDPAGRDMIEVAQPLLADAPSPAVALAHLDLVAIAGGSGLAGLPDGTRIEVLDPAARIVATVPLDPGLIGQAVEPQVLGAIGQDRAAGQTDGVVSLTGGGQLAWATTGSPGQAGYVVLARVPALPATAAAAEALARSVAVMGAVLLGSLGLAWLGGRWLVAGPLERLTAAVRRLQAGDLGAASGIRAGGGEIGVLAEAFDAMSLALARREQELRDAGARLEEIIERAPSPMAVLDQDGVIQRANVALAALLGMPADAGTPLPFRQDESGSAAQGPLVPGPEGTVTRTGLLDVGSGRVPVRASFTPLGDAAGSVLVVLADLTEERRRETELLRLAETDPLTGLPNRRFLERHLALALDRPEGPWPALLCLDLDRFKPINDELGHAQGDQVLAAIAGILRGSCREGDLAARLGGDEFVVVLEQGSPAQAMLAAERLRHAVGEYRLDAAGRTWRVGVSIGIALGAPDLTPEELLARADAACYAAKRSGRNTISVWTG